MYKKQIDQGRLFLHEHPATATSWSLEEVGKVATYAGVDIITADLCMHGLMTTGPHKIPTPAQKKTKFMTNSTAIGK